MAWDLKPKKGLSWEEIYRSELILAYLTGFGSGLVLLLIYSVLLKIV